MEKVQSSTIDSLRWVALKRRIRGLVDDSVVVDSWAPLHVWEPHRVVGCYAVPVGDVASSLEAPRPAAPPEGQVGVLTPADAFSVHTTTGTVYDIRTPSRTLTGAALRPDDADLGEYVLLDWSAFDEWREEDEVVLGHPHDPFHRIDCLTTSRHVRVSVGDTVLAESRRPTLLLETGLPPRHYLPRDDVRWDVLQPSDTSTMCAYKGRAEYWSAVVGDEVIHDVAWSYRDPMTDGKPVRDLICFYDDRVDVALVGE